MLSRVLAMKFGGAVVVVSLAFGVVVKFSLGGVSELSAIALRKFTIKTIKISFSFIAANFFFEREIGMFYAAFLNSTVCLKRQARS